MDERLTKEDLAFFCNHRTSLEDIKNAGWDVYPSSSGSWWFRHREDGRRFSLYWVQQLETLAEKRGAHAVQAMIKVAIGL